MINGKSFVGRSFPGQSFRNRTEISSSGFIDALRRDAAFIWNVLISAVFVVFVALAVASAVLDLIAIRQ